MFQSLASYFLGNSTDSENTVLDNQKPVDTNLKTKIITKPCLDTNSEDECEISDWLLVDKDDSSEQTDSEGEIPFVEIKNAPPLRRGRHSRNNSGAGSHDGLLSLSPTSLLPSSMEESWFVTPPPCFTSTAPIVIEMSPLENLLIEHPSMSVYHSMRKSLTNEADEDEDIILVDLDNDVIHPHPAAERSPSHTVRVRSEHGHPAGSYRSIKQYIAASSSQKNHGHKHTQAMCRNALERSNKVRESNCKGGRQKRSDMNHCKVISRANNNRKC